MRHAPEQIEHGIAAICHKAEGALRQPAAHLQQRLAWCVGDNAASARVLEKVGMSLEGREREKEWITGAWHDRMIYAILEREWRVQNQ